MNFRFGKASLERLAGVDERLRAVCHLALCKSSQDFLVLEGRRTVQRQHELYGQGRTADQLRAVGVDPKHAKPAMPKVTWTLNSNHFTGRAVDLVPWPIDWNTPAKFDAIAKAMFSAAEALGTPIRWGKDWNQNGRPGERGETDSPHFELVG
jgi:peptidoglycan L-alanyl-D-glutamate endopeptidase CwlK